MKRIAVIVGLGLLVAVASVQGQETYHNSKWNFSFTLPEDWEVISDKDQISELTKDLKLRFENLEVLTLCRKIGDEENNFMIMQASHISDREDGVIYEQIMQKQLKSDYYTNGSRQYLKKLKLELVGKDEYGNYPVFYDRNKHVLYEILVIGGKKTEASMICTATILGRNRMAILSFDLYDEYGDADGLRNLIEDLVASSAYDEGSGYGEQTPFNALKSIWYGMGGLGTIIIFVVIYKWVSG